MPLLTQYASFFFSLFGEKTVCEELNGFLKNNRIVNVEKRLIDGEPAGFFLWNTAGNTKTSPLPPPGGRTTGKS
jgi:hypothetical protein